VAPLNVSLNDYNMNVVEDSTFAFMVDVILNSCPFIMSNRPKIVSKKRVSDRCKRYLRCTNNLLSIRDGIYDSFLCVNSLIEANKRFVVLHPPVDYPDLRLTRYVHINGWIAYCYGLDVNTKFGRKVLNDTNFINHINPDDVYGIESHEDAEYLFSIWNSGFLIKIKDNIGRYGYMNNVDCDYNVGFCSKNTIGAYGKYYIDLKTGKKFKIKRVYYDISMSFIIVEEGTLIFGLPDFVGCTYFRLERVFVARESFEFKFFIGDKAVNVVIFVLRKFSKINDRYLFANFNYDQLKHLVLGVGFRKRFLLHASDLSRNSISYNHLHFCNYTIRKNFNCYYTLNDIIT